MAGVGLVTVEAMVHLRESFEHENIIRLCKTTFYTGFNTANYAKTYAKGSFTQAGRHEAMKQKLS